MQSNPSHGNDGTAERKPVERFDAAREQLKGVRRARVYTDGACSNNPGPGGWGILVEYDLGGERCELPLWGGAIRTTNNRMELAAALVALRLLPRDCRIEIHTDSKYLQQGMTEWLARWRERGWRTADRKPVRNTGLWRKLNDMVSDRDVSWHWVKAHSGVPGNERADALARRGMQHAQRN